MEVKKVNVWNGRRYTAKHNASIGDVGATCDTAAEAKEKCMALATESLAGSYTPGFVRHGNVVCIWYCTPDGWMYRITDNIEGRLDSCCCPDRTETRESVERRARLHMAMGYIGGEAGYDVIKHPEDIEKYKEDLAWQERYRQFKAQGMTDSDAHLASHGMFHLIKNKYQQVG